MAPRPIVARRPAGALTTARGGPAGRAKAKLAKNPPATASVRTAPKSGAAREDKQAAAKPRAEANPPETLVIRSSFIDYLDVSTLRGQSSFQTWAARVTPGMALVAPVYDSQGLRVGDCILQVIAALDYKTGRYVEADLVSWSSAEARREIKDVKEGGEVMIHLCKSSGSCKDGFQASKVVHLREWKVCEPRQLDESYLTSAQRRLLDKMAPPEQNFSVIAPDDLEDPKATPSSKPRASASGVNRGSDRAPSKGTTGTVGRKAKERITAIVPEAAEDDADADEPPSKRGQKKRSHITSGEDEDEADDDGGGVDVSTRAGRASKAPLGQPHEQTLGQNAGWQGLQRS